MEKGLNKMPRVRANLPLLIEPFCTVFRENSKRVRAIFFDNDLVRFMWSHYIHADEPQIANFFADMINVKERQSEAGTLLKDILVLSKRLNFQILHSELLDSFDHINKKTNSKKRM